MKFDLSLLMPILVPLAGAVAPVLTEYTKKAVLALGSKIPVLVKPILNVFYAALVGGLVTGGDALGAAVGGLAGVASSVGFSVGKSS